MFSQNLSVKAAAARMGCSPQTVRRLIVEGHIEAFRYRQGQVYVSLASIEDFMNAVRIRIQATDDMCDDELDQMCAS